MGNYVTSADIFTTNGLSDAQIDNIIESWEDFVETYCNDIFYESDSHIFKFRGNDKVSMFTNILIPYDLVSITSIEDIDAQGNLTTVDADYYEFTGYSITRVTGRWLRSRRMGYKVTCTMGNGETDINGNTNKRFKPEGIKSSIITLVNREINQIYGTVSGTATIDPDTLDGYDFKHEERFDYQYDRRKPESVDVNSEAPTGIPHIDLKLVNLQRKQWKFMTTDRNPNKYGNMSEAADIRGA